MHARGLRSWSNRKIWRWIRFWVPKLAWLACERSARSMEQFYNDVCLSSNPIPFSRKGHRLRLAALVDRPSGQVESQYDDAYLPARPATGN
jgi:hypothetical protein